MSGNAAFGIDHPLIAVDDIELVRRRLRAIGFDMTPVGRHPWGTSTSLAVFAGCLLEIVGIGDESLLDENPAGDFRFGRHVHRHLTEREGVALTALHSLDTEADAARARAAGFEVTGQIEFGRDVTLPDGRADRTRTTLALLPDREHQRLSFFLCHQHRRDLVEAPGWMTHPNAVVGIDGITVLADASLHGKLGRRLGALYGPPESAEGGFDVRTANGTIAIRTREAVAREVVAPLPDALDDGSPSVIAMTFRSGDMARTDAALAASGFEARENDGTIVMIEAPLFGNTFLSFRAAGRAPGEISP